MLPNLPLGTLIANLSGGFMMGMVLAGNRAWYFRASEVTLIHCYGFLGGLTTFSAFTGESLSLLQKTRILVGGNPCVKPCVWCFIDGCNRFFNYSLFTRVSQQKSPDK